MTPWGAAGHSNKTACRTPTPLAQPIEALVDLLQLQAVGGQLVDRQAAGDHVRGEVAHFARRHQVLHRAGDRRPRRWTPRSWLSWITEYIGA